MVKKVVYANEDRRVDVNILNLTDTSLGHSKISIDQTRVPFTCLCFLEALYCRNNDFYT